MKTLVQMLQTVARENAGRMAVVDGNLSVSYELLARNLFFLPATGRATRTLSASRAHLFGY